MQGIARIFGLGGGKHNNDPTGEHSKLRVYPRKIYPGTCPSYAKKDPDFVIPIYSKLFQYIFFVLRANETDECATFFGNRWLPSVEVTNLFSLHSRLQLNLLILQDLTFFVRLSYMFLLQA